MIYYVTKIHAFICCLMYFVNYFSYVISNVHMLYVLYFSYHILHYVLKSLGFKVVFGL